MKKNLMWVWFCLGHVMLIIGMDGVPTDTQSDHPLYRSLTTSNNTFTCKQLSYALSSSLHSDNYSNLLRTARSIGVRYVPLSLSSCALQYVMQHHFADAFQNELTYLRTKSLKLTNIINDFLVCSVVYGHREDMLYLSKLGGSVVAIANPLHSIQTQSVYKDTLLVGQELTYEIMVHRENKQKPMLLDYDENHIFYVPFYCPCVLRAIDLTTRSIFANSTPADAKIRASEYDGDRNILYVGLANGNIGFYSTDCTKILPSLKIFSSPIHAIKQYNNYSIAVSGRDSCIKIWDIRMLSRMPMRIFYHNARVTDLAILSDDKTTLLSASEDKTIRFWKDNYCVHRIETNMPIMRLMVDGKLMISQHGGPYRELRFWDIDTDDCVGALKMRQALPELLLCTMRDGALVTSLNRRISIYTPAFDSTDQKYNDLISGTSLLGLYCARRLHLFTQQQPQLSNLNI